MTQFSNLQDSIADLADLSFVDGGHRLSDDAIPVRSSLLSSHGLCRPHLLSSHDL